MSRFPKRHFWEWFKRHNKEYLELNKKTKKEAAYWLRELSAHLRAYFKFFSYSLMWPNNGPARLTITANAKAMHFKKIDTFVATAPEIPGWNIIALEDPMPIDFLLEKQIEETNTDPRELCFSFDNTTEHTNIIVYHPLCTGSNRHLLLQLAYAAVYNLLGERSFGLDIGRVEVANLSYADPEEVYPLEELPMHMGLCKSSIVVDSQGALLGMH